MYYIIELQTQADGTGAHLVQTATSLNEAQSKYHSVLAYAATSTLLIHAAAILSADGTPIAHECYVHEAEPHETEE